ncbi:MAG: hypothetical protein V3S55_06345 [Nitrospiraceae bacterium]
MRVDREQYAELVRKKANGQDNRVHLEALVQAEVKAEHVTGDPHWDTFLSYIQAAIEKHEDELVSLTTMLESPDMMNTDDMMNCKIAVIRRRERISAWKSVIGLPRDIKEHGEKAKALLDVMEDITEE